MRPIKFRGKGRKTGKWFYGNLYVEDSFGRTHICTPERGCFDIDPGTVGQFTGLYDCDGKEIYEGDKLYVNSSNKIFTGVVTWDKNLAYYKLLDIGDTNILHQTPLFRWLNIDTILEVIGNIHDATLYPREDEYFQ